MQEVVIEARDSYLKHLRDGGQRVKLRKPKHRHVPDVIHPSALGLCPLKAALRDTVPPYPELAPDGDALWRMEHGTRIAEFFQEAFIFKYGRQRVKEEKLIKRWGLRGYADILMDEQTIIEIKNVRENYPKLQVYQVLQVLAYGFMLESPFMYIVTVNRNMVNTYRLEGDWDTQFNVVNDETDEPVSMPMKFTRMELLDEITRHKRYMAGHRADPMPNFLNDEYSWLCVDKKTKPKDGKPGKYLPVCPNFCHHSIVPGQEYEYNVVDGKFVSLESVF